MVVKFIKGAKCGVLESAIMAATLSSGRSLRFRHPFVMLEVEEWVEFLKIVSKAFAECSRDHRGAELVKGISVSIEYKGNTYCTRVWYDMQAKGLRYVSLD